VQPSGLPSKDLFLKQAVENGNALEISNLISTGANINQGDGELLDIAYRNGDLNNYQLLFNYGAVLTPRHLEYVQNMLAKWNNIIEYLNNK
jgi:hypothetical protein